MKIIDRILSLMEKQKLSQYKVAKDCALPYTAFNAWTSGKQKPSLDALIKIADYFDVSLDYLVGRKTAADTQNQSNSTNNVTTAPVLNKWEQLNKIQQEKVLSYMDAMIDDTPDFIKGEMVGRQKANQQKINLLNVETPV